MSTRVVVVREVGDRGEQRRLCHVQLRGGLAEVGLRCGLDAIRAPAQEDLVQVELEQLVLGERALQLERHVNLPHLAGERLGAGQLVTEDVPRELHREGGESLGKPPLHDVREQGAEEAAVVDPVMLVEAPVLDGDERRGHGGFAAGRPGS